MDSRENFFLYAFLCAPGLGVLIAFWVRFIHKCYDIDTSIHVVEPIQLVQQIHMVEPLAIAESVDSDRDEDLQFALTLHLVPSVPLPQIRLNSQLLYI